jgi:hypothetical protein
MFKPRQKQSFFNRLSGIASICSAALICIRLAYYGILSVEWAGLIMIAVVVMAAIGNTATKLGICAVAVFLFAKYVSHGNQAQFQGVLGAILALLIALIGFYIMLRGVFSK